MEDQATRTSHTFHIPVMGTGFTIDTPLRVAHYGISSAISLVDDDLIEQMRELHCRKAGEPYEPIATRDRDARARRITAYLDLLDRLVGRQVAALRASPFASGSEITRYYEILPETPLKEAYHKMLQTDDPVERARLQDRLRRLVTPGSIDVNIMTKLDRAAYRGGHDLGPEFSDALTALRGFAKSTLSSSVVFSAGMNPRLYAYIAEFDDFLPDAYGAFKKKVILKVSDYRSAVVQGKYLAKRAVWVSEYRLESGLNCGGHAFATKGLLMGPILEEFKQKKRELAQELHAVYTKALAARDRSHHDVPKEFRITAQGGIGTATENKLLETYYDVDGTGWGTPFLLVPEVTNVDPESRDRLAGATDRDVTLSDSSPLGIPFWNLRGSSSEQARRRRIHQGEPGSPCPKGFAATNTEFTTTVLCVASRAYQRRKLYEIEQQDLTEPQRRAAREQVLGKSCICHDLGGGATLNHDIDRSATPAVCSGPNIANFSKIATLEEMVSHIYGRASLPIHPLRPHMFIRELMLYVDYFRRQRDLVSQELTQLTPQYFCELKENLLSGIEYYRRLAEHFISQRKAKFIESLATLREEIEHIGLTEAIGANSEND